jgi:hypothetical protein
MGYVTPRTWSSGDPLSSSYLNVYVRDNVDYLFNRNRHIVNLKNVTAIAVSATTSWSAIDDAQLSLEITTYGGDVELDFCATVRTGTGGQLNFDFIKDGTTYLSSNTGTPLAGGSYYMDLNTTSEDRIINVKLIVTGLSAGTYTFKPRVSFSTSATVTFMASASTLLCMAKEF